MNKVLVTGATGFIGNRLIQFLLKENFPIIATSSDAAKAETFDWFNQVTYIPFDLKETSNDINLYEYFNRPDIVFHLAWQGLPNYKNDFHIKQNLPLHYSFLENLIHNGLKDVTITGTCFEYGMQEGSLTETMDANPANAYAIAKNELRKKLVLLQDKIPFSLKWLRLFYMYGDGKNSNSLIAQLNAAIERGDQNFNMSGGEQLRDFLPVEKVVEYIAKSGLQKHVEGIINISSNKPVTVKQFVLDYLASKHQSISLHLGYYPYSDIEPMNFWGDNNKLKSIIHDE
ncbi:MAG: NAD(P)-dependent oxidoreductase [Arachidicoccus sp.]|nr:NAD(P)-dependent oxidoreductase [Arachidicoccus sp.]